MLISLAKKESPAVTSPFAHYDEMVAITTEYARAIAPRHRPRFYERICELMRGAEIGPGACARACREAQREFLNAPAPASPSKQPPRGPFRRRG